jgi:hypothetical protein
MKYIIGIVIAAICFQCAQRKNELPVDRSQRENAQRRLLLKQLGGVGESGISGFYNDWLIKIYSDSTIELLCSMKKDSADSRSFNRQYFGHFGGVGTHGHKIILDKGIAVDDCNKPVELNTGVIPFLVDSGLFATVHHWDLEVKGNNIRITEPCYKFAYTGASELDMKLSPDSTSGFYPVSIRTKGNCGIDIMEHNPEMDFYITTTDSGFEFTTDRTAYLNVPATKCDYCIKTIELKDVGSK